MHSFREQFKQLKFLGLVLLLVLGSGCASLRSFFALDTQVMRKDPIANPFLDYNPKYAKTENVILRTKKGDRSIEVEFPHTAGELSNLSVPISPAFGDSNRSFASVGEDGMLMDESLRSRKPSYTDREIVASLPQNSAIDKERAEVESSLGLTPAEDSAPASDRSYLTNMDYVKSLYRGGRYEVALVELDEMIRSYPTDAKLYSMRGTLLERIGQNDLAVKSWSQALRLEPNNLSLKKFIERKNQKRSLASQ